MSELAAHLGGHSNKTWFDRGSLKWMMKNYGVKSMVDVGCGPGGQVSHARRIGLEAVGIDGDHTVNPDVLLDFTVGTWETDKTFDLAWSVEFLEHVPEEHMHNYMKIFDKCNYVICTCNMDPGPLHVNCKERDYWIEKFKEYGFVFSQKILDEVLENSTMDKKRGKESWLEKTGMVFVKENLL